MWFRGRWEASIEANMSREFTLSDEGINEQQVRLGGRHYPPAVRGHVYTNNRVSQRRKRCLGVLADGIKQPDVTLGTRNCQSTSGGRRDAGKRVLAGILLILTVDHFVTRNPRINTEQGVVRNSNDRLLACRLCEFAVRRDVVDGDVVMDLPLFHNFATFNVQAEKGMRGGGVLQNHFGILIV
jgi:hypothetical protein